MLTRMTRTDHVLPKRAEAITVYFDQEKIENSSASAECGKTASVLAFVFLAASRIMRGFRTPANQRTGPAGS
jgi:hypothetical protein